MHHRNIALAVLPLLGACATGGGDDPAGIRGVEWNAVNIAGSDAASDTQPTLRLQRNGRVAGGSGGCNTWSAEYRLGPGTIELSDLTSTRRACPEPLMRQESTYLALLQRVDRYVVWPDGTLTLAAPGGRTVTFQPAEPADGE